MVNLLVGNIQKFCIYDGPGIRTTVFLTGCPIHCPWCANPENRVIDIRNSAESQIFDQRWMSDDQIFEECVKDVPFYGENGGVTFSGGEPLFRANDLIGLFSRFKRNGIGICVETSLFVPSRSVECILGLVDHWIVDVKVLDSELCFKALGGDLDQYLKCLALVENSNDRITYRFPLVMGYTFTADNRQLLIDFMSRRIGASFQLIKCHNLGNHKYHKLGQIAPKFEEIPETEYLEFLSDLAAKGIHATELML